MALFDIVEATGRGYKVMWDERQYLLKIAAVPVLVKCVCLTAIVALGWEDQFLRQALVMLPSYFTDGWLLAHLVRFIFYGQRWPFRPSGRIDKDLPVIEDRAQGIMKGTLVFVLIKYLLSGVTAAIYAVAGTSMESPAQEGDPLMLFLACVALVVVIWAFRFLWFYIPAAINYSMTAFMIHLNGMSSSFYLIGTWILCFVPLLLVYGLIASMMIAPYQEVETLPFNVEFMLNILRALMDTSIGLLSTAGMAYGFKMMLGGGKPENEPS